MERNIGSIDRIARIAIGLALIAFALLIDGPYHWIGLLGIVPLATAGMNWCPLYTVLGIRTCPMPPKT